MGTKFRKTARVALLASATAFTLDAAPAQADICTATGDEFWDAYRCPAFGETIFNHDFGAVLEHPPEDVRACVHGWYGSVMENATTISVGAAIMGEFAPDIPHKLEMGSQFNLPAWSGDAQSILKAGKGALRTWQRARGTSGREDFDIAREADAIQEAAKSFYPRSFRIRDSCAIDGRIWIRHVNEDPEWGLAYLRAVEAFIRDAY